MYRKGVGHHASFPPRQSINKQVNSFAHRVFMSTFYYYSVNYQSNSHYSLTIISLEEFTSI